MSGSSSAAGADVPQTCTGQLRRLGNGIQIFPGSVPIYSGGSWSAASACRATASTRTT